MMDHDKYFKLKLEKAQKCGYSVVWDRGTIWSIDKNNKWYYGDDMEYSPCSIEQRKNDFYVQYYGCDIHCCSSLDNAKAFVIHYLSTPRNPAIAEYQRTHPVKKYVPGGSEGNH